MRPAEGRAFLRTVAASAYDWGSSRSPSNALLPFFLAEGSPTKIDYNKKGTLLLTSLLEDLALFAKLVHRMATHSSNARWDGSHSSLRSSAVLPPSSCWVWQLGSTWTCDRRGSVLPVGHDMSPEKTRST